MQVPLDPATPRRPRLGWLDRQDGVETLEVALIGALVMITILITFPLLSSGVDNALQSLVTAMDNAAAGIVE